MDILEILQNMHHAESSIHESAAHYSSLRKNILALIEENKKLAVENKELREKSKPTWNVPIAFMDDKGPSCDT